MRSGFSRRIVYPKKVKCCSAVECVMILLLIIVHSVLYRSSLYTDLLVALYILNCLDVLTS